MVEDQKDRTDAPTTAPAEPPREPIAAPPVPAPVDVPSETPGAPPHQESVDKSGRTLRQAQGERTKSFEIDPPTARAEPVEARDTRKSATLAAAAIVIVGCAILHLWGLGKAPFHTRGEPREAIIVQEITAGRNWILPRRNGIELPAKPPLFHWLGAAAALAQGRTDEGSVRLPSAISSAVAALLVLATGAIIWGPAAGLVAALTLLTSFEWSRAATSARVDMTLTAGLTAALCGLLLFRLRGGRGWLLLAYAGTAWAVLSKGPVGLALPLLHIIVTCLFDRSIAFARQLRLGRGLLVVLAIGGLWYVLAYLRGGDAFFAKQILTENVWRFLGSKDFTEGHRHSVLYLFAMLLAGLLPWTLLLPPATAALWRERRRWHRHDPAVFLLTWSLIVFGMYAFATSKRGVYLLAMYPALALLIGRWLTARDRAPELPVWLRRVLTPLVWALAVLLAVLALISLAGAAGVPLLAITASLIGPRGARDLQVAQTIVAAHGGALSALLALAAFAALAAGIVARTPQSRPRALFVALLVLAGAMTVAVRQLILPEVARTQTRQRFVAAIDRVLGGERTLSSYRRFDYGVVFYWGENMPVYGESLSAAAAPPHLIVAEDEWARAAPRERRHYARVPLLESARGGNLGRLFLVQRIRDAGAARAPTAAPAAPTQDLP